MATVAAVRPIATTVPPGRRFRRTLMRSILPRIVLIVFALIFVAPFYWMVASALKSVDEGVAFPPTLIPQAWRWLNLIDSI
jgi:multiple sugar transport system permease protein